ncbi:MAG TPA: glycerophosphodiester phosphodiesterase [Cytophagales bacterium]|nr:glycerophosphodiester phosphodiesterase [Cytophagales bacterium]HAP62456.1 glycerophosphodiester phosphodiesterase [Cytophagales bacterium]
MRLGIFLLLMSASLSASAQDLDIQGHRGCRGLYPENTLAAFRHAMELGVTTLELDVVISGDGQVVVSHEPYISSTFCTGKAGGEIADDKSLNMYRMSYTEIQSYDCGTKAHPNFPEQAKMEATKPLLSVVLETIEQEARAAGRTPLRYNIEIKSKASTDGKYHPAPPEFSRRVFEVIEGRVSWNRVTIQSFDFRVLKYWHETYPEVALVALVAQPFSVKKLQRKLGFTPQVYSPYHRLLNSRAVAEFQAAGVQVIPWTVNEEEDLRKVMSLGVEGIITDYPDRLIRLVKED